MSQEEIRLGYMFRLIHLAFCRDCNKKLERHNLTSPQSDILRFLVQSPNEQATQKQIEIHLKLKNPTVTGLLNRLEEKDYVRRTKNPLDKRSHVVTLTDASRQVMEDARKDALAMEEKLSKGLTKEERENLIRYLQIVLKNIS